MDIVHNIFIQYLSWWNNLWGNILDYPKNAIALLELQKGMFNFIIVLI